MLILIDVSVVFDTISYGCLDGSVGYSFVVVLDLLLGQISGSDAGTAFHAVGFVRSCFSLVNMLGKVIWRLWVQYPADTHRLRERVYIEVGREMQ